MGPTQSIYFRSSIDYILESFGTDSRIAGLVAGIISRRRVPMQSKLIVSALVATSLLGAPVIAFAQNEAEQPAPAGAKAPATHHKMKSSHMKAGTTTGMSSSASRARPGGQSVARKPAGN
jgi:hypothetical protein